VFISCQPKALKNLTQVEKVEDVRAEAMINISVDEEKTYRAKVIGFNQEMSGILVVKKLDKDYRFVMVTDFGLKVFDLSLNGEGNFEFHHIMKYMDYEFLKNSLALNLLMLLPIDMQVETQFYKNGDLIVYAPQHKMLYFVKDEKVNQVQRFRSKRNIWATATLSNHSIAIEQEKPQILIQLKPL